MAASNTGVEPMSNAILGNFLLDVSVDDLEAKFVDCGGLSSKTMFVPIPALDQAEWIFQWVDDMMSAQCLWVVRSLVFFVGCGRCPQTEHFWPTKNTRLVVVLIHQVHHLYNQIVVIAHGAPLSVHVARFAFQVLRSIFFVFIVSKS